MELALTLCAAVALAVSLGALVVGECRDHVQARRERDAAQAAQPWAQAVERWGDATKAGAA